MAAKILSELECANCGSSKFWEIETTPAAYLLAHCADCYTGFELLGAGETVLEAAEAWNGTFTHGFNS